LGDTAGGDGSLEEESFARDQTLEILMHDLDPAAMIPFWKNPGAGFSTAADSTEKSGISGFFPDAKTDAFLFEPCGYSLNGLIGSDGKYFTIHITPQQSCSYVSFECNVEMDNYDDLIRQVLEVFKPGRYIISFFSNEGISAIQKRVTWDSPKVGYVQGARTYYNFEDYSLMFVQAKQKKMGVGGGNDACETKKAGKPKAKHVLVKDPMNMVVPSLHHRTPG